MNEEKKKQIYHGVLSLIKHGKNFRDLKVSEIAIASKIGKGTCYEYFSSKEEIIRETLIYCFRQEMADFITILDQQDTFANTFHGILSQLTLSLQACSPFQIALSAVGQDDLQLFFPDGQAMQLVYQEMTHIFTSILDQGEKEELFPHSDRSYQLFMLFGVLKSYCFSITNKQLTQQVNHEERLMEYAIQGLIRSLK